MDCWYCRKGCGVGGECGYAGGGASGLEKVCIGMFADPAGFIDSSKGAGLPMAKIGLCNTYWVREVQCGRSAENIGVRPQHNEIWERDGKKSNE
jgi:hypothetical protein